MSLVKRPGVLSEVAVGRMGAWCRPPDYTRCHRAVARGNRSVRHRAFAGGDRRVTEKLRVCHRFVTFIPQARKECETT